MFGYTVKAEWARVIVHASYLAVALPLIMWIYKKKEVSPQPINISIVI
jgi:hypothetical protein